MSTRVPTHRSVLRRMQEAGPAPARRRTADHEARLAAHERRIHNHPCPCGSGKRYVDCCIDRANQEALELKHRRRRGATREDV